MAVSGLGKDTGDVYRLMSPGIMGKGTRYSYGYCWGSFEGNLLSHEVGGLSCRLRASRGRPMPRRPAGRGAQLDTDNGRQGRSRKGRTTGRRREDELPNASPTDGASTVLDVPQ